MNCESCLNCDNSKYNPLLEETDQMYNLFKLNKIYSWHSRNLYSHLLISPTNRHNTFEVELNPLSLKHIKKNNNYTLQNVI